MNALYFDLDGTLADLYSVKNWCYRITHNDPTPYEQAKPLVNIASLKTILREFKQMGILIGVISWSAKGASREFTREVKKSKIAWLKNHGIEVDEVHVVKYGTPKKRVAKVKNSVLIDDDEKNLDQWNGRTIDAKQSRFLLSNLSYLLEEMKEGN